MKKILVIIFVVFIGALYPQDIIIVKKSNLRDYYQSSSVKWVLGLTQQIPLLVSGVTRENGRWKIVDNIKTGYAQTLMLYKPKLTSETEIYQPVLGAGVVLLAGYQDKSSDFSAGAMVSIGNISLIWVYNFINKNIIITGGVQYNIPVFVEIKKW